MCRCPQTGRDDACDVPGGFWGLVWEVMQVNTTEERIGCDVFRGSVECNKREQRTEFGDLAGVSSMKEAKDRIRYVLSERC
jgi:hypothetical protein